MAQYDDVNSRSIFLMGIYSAVITLTIVIGCQVLYYAMRARHDEKKLSHIEYADSVSVIKAQTASLQVYGKEEREDGPVKREYIKVPIDVAIKAYLKEQGQAKDAKTSKDDA